VDEAVAYRTVVGMSGEIDPVREAVASDRRPVVVFASPSAVDGFARELGSRALARARCVAIGPTTARRVSELTEGPTAVARTPDVLGLVAAIVAAARANEEKMYVDTR
jgi:uroporphyrinogen-III synthase